MTIINTFLTFNTLIIFFFYSHHIKKKQTNQQDSQQVSVGSGGHARGMGGSWETGRAARSPRQRGSAMGGTENPPPALEERGRLAVLTSVSAARPERHTGPDDLSTSTYLLDLYHD